MNIDKATELFRKQLEGGMDQNKSSQPSIKGGLPPHLLRQKGEKDAPTAKPGASIGRHRASPRTAQHGHVNTRQDQSQGRPSEIPPAHDYGDSQGMPRPSEFSASDYPTQQQQLLLRTTTTPSQIHHVRDLQVKPSKGIVSRPDPPTPYYTTARRPPQHSHPQVQQRFSQKQRVLTPTGGNRLSVRLNDDWAPFISNDGEQRKTNTFELQLDQIKVGKWRPKHSCDLQSQDLPDPVAVSLDFNDSDSNFLSKDSVPDTPDIRNTIGGELDLLPKIHGKGFYNKNRWDEYPDESKCLEWRPTYSHLWVKGVENEEWPIAVFMNIKDLAHQKCDVQTSNGWLMAPVDYPDTRMNPKEIQNNRGDRAVARRLNDCASLKMTTQYRRLKRRVDEREGEMKWEPAEEPLPFADQRVEQPGGQRTGQPTPPPTQSYVNRSPVMNPGKAVYHPERKNHHRLYGTVTHLSYVYEHEAPQTYLKIACFLRPAEETDIPQLLDIYNWEVAYGIQALDTKHLCLKDMERVFKQCRHAKTPIIVAIAGTSAEAKASKHPSVAPRGRCETAQKGPQQLPQSLGKDRVIGFGYVSIPKPGLAGDVQYNVYRFEGQVHIYVAHECRRKGIGRALLQRITIFCSRHASLYAYEYEWQNSERTSTYDDAFHNSRNYSRISIEAASRAKDDPDTLWMSEFLDTENFCLVSTKRKARKVGYGEKGAWVDCLVWQHDCQDLDKLEENDPKPE